METTSNTPSFTVTGNFGTVSRVAPKDRGHVVPVGNPSHLVDVWGMPGGMDMICLRNGAWNDYTARYVFLLAYVDAKVRGLCQEHHLDESLAVDVWHVQAMSSVISNDTDARATMRHLANAAASGAIPFSPIRREDRTLWQVAVDTLCVLAVGAAIREPARKPAS